MRSTYRLLAGTKKHRTDWLENNPGHSDLVADRKSWKKLWGLQVPSKICVFAWRLAQTLLPAGDVRNHRKMAKTPACGICHADRDTWCHSLFECRMAKCVWALMEEELTNVVISNRSEDAKVWLFWLLDTLPPAELTRVLVTMWAIWWTRRRTIHDDQFQSPMSTACFITKFLKS